MLFHKGLTHAQSQIKPRLPFGEHFTLSCLVSKMLDNGEKKVAQCLFFKCLTDTQFTFIEEKEKKPDNIHISQADSRE